MNKQTRSTNTMNHAMVVTRAQAEREKEEAELQRQQRGDRVPKYRSDGDERATEH